MSMLSVAKPRLELAVDGKELQGLRLYVACHVKKDDFLLLAADHGLQLFIDEEQLFTPVGLLCLGVTHYVAPYLVLVEIAA